MKIPRHERDEIKEDEKNEPPPKKSKRGKSSSAKKTSFSELSSAPLPLQTSSSSQSSPTNSSAFSSLSSAASSVQLLMRHHQLIREDRNRITGRNGGVDGSRGYSHQLLKSVEAWLMLRPGTSDFVALENAEDWELYCERLQDKKFPTHLVVQEKDHSQASSDKSLSLSSSSNEAFIYWLRCYKLYKEHCDKPFRFRFVLSTTRRHQLNQRGSAERVPSVWWQEPQDARHHETHECLTADEMTIRLKAVFMRFQEELPDLTPADVAGMLRCYFINVGAGSAVEQNSDSQKNAKRAIATLYASHLGSDDDVDLLIDQIYDALAASVLFTGLSKEKSNRVLRVYDRDAIVELLHDRSWRLKHKHQQLLERYVASETVQYQHDEDDSERRKRYQSRCEEVLPGGSITDPSRIRTLSEIFWKVFKMHQPLTVARADAIGGLNVCV